MTFIVFWIIAAISAAGYSGSAGLMARESACLPLPSEIIKAGFDGGVKQYV